jgi:hypothetical protein
MRHSGQNMRCELVARHQRRESWGRRVARWIIAGRKMQHPCDPPRRSLGFGRDGSVKYSVRMRHGTLRVVIQPDWRGM